MNMEVSLVRQIVAAVLLQKDEGKVAEVPVFYAQSKEEQQEMAFLLGRLLDGVVHDVGNDTLVIIKY